MLSISGANARERAVFILYALLFMYYFYRYALQMNSTSTSPTYTDTPALFQAGKYCLSVLAVLYITFVYVRDRIRLSSTDLLFLLFASVTLLKSVCIDEFDWFLKVFVLAMPAYLILVVEKKNRLKVLYGVIIFVFCYHLLYEAIQVFLYEHSGRLPALAYEHGLVRFGAGWDDPNAFGVFLLIPTVYSMTCIYRNQNRVRSAFVFLLCLLMMLLTISFAAFGAMGVAFILYVYKYRYSAGVWVAAAVAIACLLAIAISKQDLITSILLSKSASTSIHLQQLSLGILDTNDVCTLLFGNMAEAVSFENFYRTVFQNYGLILLVSLICIEVYVIFKGTKKLKRTECPEKDLSLLAFVLAVPICQLGVPYLQTFPINLLYWMIAVYFVHSSDCKLVMAGSAKNKY